MITLAHVTHEHRRAVERELLCLHWRFSDVGKSLSLNEFASIVLAAPPDSAVGFAVTEGWTLANHLIASLCELQAGLIGLKSRLPRPGVDYGEVPEATEYATNEQPYNNVRMQSMTVEELQARKGTVNA